MSKEDIEEAPRASAGGVVIKNNPWRKSLELREISTSANITTNVRNTTTTASTTTKSTTTTVASETTTVEDSFLARGEFQTERNKVPDTTTPSIESLEARVMREDAARGSRRAG